MVGPQILNQDMPGFPTSTLTTPLTLNFDNAPLGLNTAWAGMPYKVYANGALIKEGVMDDSGAVELNHSPAIQKYKVVLANGVVYDIPVVDTYRNAKEGPLAASGIFKGESKQGSSASRNDYVASLKALVNVVKDVT